MFRYKFWITRLCVGALVVLVVTACQSLEQTVNEPTTEPATATATDVIAVPTAISEPATPTTQPVVVVDIVETAVPPPTPTPPPPEPTATPVPTNMPPPEPTPEPTPIPPTAVPAVPLPDWLSYFNLFREMADLPPVSEQNVLTLGSRLHSRYMVVNDDPIAHTESKDNPLYDEAGDWAARNSNIFATSQTDANYLWGINFWVSAPFHLIPMLHPGLGTIGYGDYVENSGDVRMAAVVDVRTDRNDSPVGVTYPIYFPKDGAETWIVRQSLFEWPEPYGNCPGYGNPSGPAIVLQLGDGDITPRVTSHSVAMGDEPIESCIFDETNYRNANAYAQDIGRTILGSQDAIIVIPRYQLPIDQTYTVQVDVNGQTHIWSFRTRKGPPD